MTAIIGVGDASHKGHQMKSITIEESGAFMEQFTLAPTGSGPLDGLTFAVKDLIDVAGHHTGCGNPTWKETHPPASVSAVCVEQLLAAGARCEGKTITDEIAFSLIGQNYFYGTPLNPAAPERVPGGSSNGSASAVACGLVDFALGTDTGGSVRVPASFCGIFGLRPSHGLISVAGVMPFSPTFDTVGLFARKVEVLAGAAAVLLPAQQGGDSKSPRAIHIVRDAFELADEEVRQALRPAVDALRDFYPGRVRESSLSELCGDKRAGDSTTWLTIYRMLQGVEMISCLGDWMATAKPKFGPAPSMGLEYVKKIDRTQVGESITLRETYCRGMKQTLAEGDLLCLPTFTTIAPLKGFTAYRRDGGFYERALPVTAIAGVCRLPQLSLPVAKASGAPVGLSLVAAHGEDIYLIEKAREFLAMQSCTADRR